MSQKTINEAVVEACSERGSQEALARELKVSATTVSEWVLGKRPVPLARCIEIQQLTGVACDRLNRSIDWARLRSLPPAPLKARTRARQVA